MSWSADRLEEIVAEQDEKIDLLEAENKKLKELQKDFINVVVGLMACKTPEEMQNLKDILLAAEKDLMEK